MRELRGGEELRGTVRASGHTGAAADASRRVHGNFSVGLGHRYGIAIGRAARGNGDESAGGDDTVEGAAIDDQVALDGEGFRTPGLQR